MEQMWSDRGGGVQLWTYLAVKYLQNEVRSKDGY